MKQGKKYGPSYRGDVPGCWVGQMFDKRVDMMAVRMHQQSQAGIDGKPETGCYSIVLNAGYEDDVDNGEEVTYTGCGGIDPKGGQIKDQEFTGKNASLVVSCQQKWPVRVIRGHNCPSQYAPLQGYRYDGLYEVLDWWAEEVNGFKMCKYRLKRLPGQPPLPIVRPDRKNFIKPRRQNKIIATRPPCDLGFTDEPLEIAIERSEKGYCVVCGKQIEGGCDAEHIESHFLELWNAFGDTEKEKLAVRSFINSERINIVQESLAAAEPVVPQKPSSVFVWP